MTSILFLIETILTQWIQIHLSHKQKDFSQLFSEFFKFKLNFERFEKKITIIAYVFPTLRTPKNVLR